ncbi:MAG: ABC transporter permease [Bacilli bacterium]|nr:ABC transporter permease [Bacilli bacterium]
MNKKTSYSKLSFKRLGRAVKKSPLQFLAMILILMLATTIFSGFYATSIELENRITDYYEKSNMADVWTTTFTDPETFTPEGREKDKNDIKSAAAAYNGVVESRYYSQAKVNGRNSYICLSDQFPTICVPYETDNVEKTDFLIIDKRFDKDEGLKEFQFQINIASLNSFISDNKVKEVLESHLKPGKTNIFANDVLVMDAKITGYMLHPESVLSSDITTPIFLMSRSYINKLLISLVDNTFDKNWEPISKSEEIAHELLNDPQKNISDKYWYDNQYLTRLPNRNDASTVKDLIHNSFASRPHEDNDLLLNVDLKNLESNKNIAADLIQARQMTFTFPAIFFLVAVLVVSTTISQIILKERNEIGTLRALGASSKKIASHYVILECLIGLIGIVIGAIIGPLILPKIMEIKYGGVYNLPTQGFAYPTLAVIILTLVILAIIALVSYITAYKEAKQLPVISMRPKVVKKNKHLLKNELTKEKNKTHKLCFKMAIRNIFLSSTRSIMVVLGVLGCTGLLCCGYGVDDAIQFGINHDMNCYFNADAMVYFSSGGYETVDELEKLVKENLISKYEAASLLPATCYKAGISDSSFTTQVYSINSDTYKQNKFINIGDYEVRKNSVVVTSKVAKALNLGVGDYLHFTFLGTRYSGIVGGILDSFYVQGILIDGSNWPAYPSFLTSPTVFVRYQKDAKPEEVVTRIKAIEGVSDVSEYKDRVQVNQDTMSSLSYITLVIKLFAILLAVIVLYNLALLNFKENTRNVATMKVLGFTRREIAESLVMEIMILTTIGIVFGLAVGFPLEILILSINKTPINEFIFYISPLTFVYSFLITILVSLAVNIYLSLKSKKVKMVESLKSIE